MPQPPSSEPSSPEPPLREPPLRAPSTVERAQSDDQALRALRFASLLPIGVAAVAFLAAPLMTKDSEAITPLRIAGLIGAGTGLVIAFLLGLWTASACRRGGSAFLAPLAFGFLVKAFVLGVGTWLAYEHVGQGTHIVFASCFAFSAFGFSMIATPRITRVG